MQLAGNNHLFKATGRDDKKSSTNRNLYQHGKEINGPWTLTTLWWCWNTPSLYATLRTKNVSRTALSFLMKLLLQSQLSRENILEGSNLKSEPSTLMTVSSIVQSLVKPGLLTICRFLINCYLIKNLINETLSRLNYNRRPTWFFAQAWALVVINKLLQYIKTWTSAKMFM